VIDMKDGSMKVTRTVSGQNTMKMEAQKKVSSSLKLLQLLPNYLDLKIKPLRCFKTPLFTFYRKLQRWFKRG